MCTACFKSPSDSQFCFYISEGLFPGMGQAAGMLLKPFLFVPDELVGELQAAGASKAQSFFLRAEELLKILNVSHHSSNFVKDSPTFLLLQFLL